MTRILVMAGGTGGHVFPALAVARALAERGCDIRWLGSRNGMEADLVGRAGFPIDFISIGGLRGKGVLGWAIAPIRLSRALWQSFGILRRWRPDAVLGMGGFVTGPGGVAARAAGVPLLIHEQNAIAGLTNRLLARIAGTVMEAFPNTLKGAIHTGNPVRCEIASLKEPRRRFVERTGRLRLLVIGGSLGAIALNQTVPRALALIDEPIRPEVRHQTGQRNLESARQSYREAGVSAELLPFVENMAEAYGWADLVLCRAGALTVSELAAAGVPALFVPFPHAVDDHQTRNAHFLVDARAAILLPQENLLPESLADILRDFCSDPKEGRARLAEMAETARRLASPEATQKVADYCLAAAVAGEQ